MRYPKKREADRPIAAVYRGPVACDGCAESVATLLTNSPPNFKVHYLGPKEQNDITNETMSHLDLFAWPGGGDDQASDYLKVAGYTSQLQSFVDSGGLYAGFCLGAFFARGQGNNAAFFGLLPSGSYVSSERFESKAQVKGAQDAVVQTDWTFYSGSKKGTTERGRWQYFQDGGLIRLTQNARNSSKILGVYSTTGNPCATITPFGKGQVGLIGTHPEADRSWYADWKGSNPDGIQYDMGYDFLQTLWESKTVQNPLTTNCTGDNCVSRSSGIPQASAHFSLLSFILLFSTILHMRRL